MRTLVVDNIDSFTYNLVQYVGILGGNPSVIMNSASEDDLDRAASDADRMIISPGPKRPQDAGVSNYAIREYGPSIPTLGVCLGHQCIAYVFGGRVGHAKRQMHGKTSRIEHDGAGVLRGLPNPFEATRYHSLAVFDEGLPNELRVTARTQDDDREIMALEHVKYPVFGVQFHPESILTRDGMRIIGNFLEGKK
ncbi:MAG: aminodeoxychorismate/anthranilate synthase component II [Candidatus Altiarchaeota archaeon]